MGNRLRTRLRLLPVMIAVADEVGRRGVAQFLGEILGQHLGLPDVGIVLRLIAGRIVVDLRWYITVLLLDAGKKALGAVPDCGELRCLQRRDALCCLVHERLIRFVGIPILLDDATGEAGHGGVAAALRDDGVAVILSIRHIVVEGILLQKLRQGHAARTDGDIRSAGSEEEAGGVQRLGVKVREDGIDQLLHVTVQGRVSDVVDGKQNMELGPRRFPVLLPHMEAAVVDGEGHAWKSLHDVLRRFPTGRVLGVVVVAVHRQAVAANEVVAVAVAVPILGAHIVVADGGLQAVRIQNNVLMGIGAVTGIAGDVGAIDREHQSYTS